MNKIKIPVYAKASAGKQNSKLRIITFVIIGSVALSLLLFWGFSGREVKAGILDDFAKCLSEKHITMYGAYWCPHCQNEKNAFGSSFQYVTYVECTEETKKCLDAKINGYPTWVFPDRRRFEGEQGIKKLSSESSCPLPQGY